MTPLRKAYLDELVRIQERIHHLYDQALLSSGYASEGGQPGTWLPSIDLISPLEVIVADKRPMKMVHEPGHPDADKEGYVKYPDINVVEEMANMITTMRSYEANVQAIQDTKAMFNKALQIAR